MEEFADRRPARPRPEGARPLRQFRVLPDDRDSRRRSWSAASRRCPYWLPEELDQTLTAHYSVLAGTAPRDGFELRFQRKDGTRFDALIYEAPLIDTDGKQHGWMGSILDITERKRVAELNRQHQEKLQQTSRLVTMGELASSIAHELNQPLAAIASYNAGCLNWRGPAEPPTRVSRGAGEGSASQPQRAGQIIRSVYDFVRKTEPKMAPVRPADIVETSVGLIATEARRRRVPIVVLDGSLAEPVMADRVMLEQVFVNLLRNAIDAMRETPVKARRVVISAASGRRFVTISVADKGSGVPEDTRRELFSPFSPPNLKAWVWALTSATRSSSSTRAACGSSRTRGAARSSNSRCIGRRHERPDGLHR